MRGLGLLALVFFSAAAVAQEKPDSSAMPPEAEAALARAVAVYSDGSAHSCPFAQIYTPAGFTTARRESGTVILQAPQRLRFEYTQPERKIFTYDAGEGRFYSPEDRQLTVRKLSEEEKARLPIIFLTAPAELSRAYAISVEAGQGDAPTGLLFKPRAPGPELSWLRLSVDAGGRIRDLSYEDASGNRTEFQFESWRTEKPRPAADFRVTGPPGTRIVEN
jgi:outer membrane lipoprotein carrier protein